MTSLRGLLKEGVWIPVSEFSQNKAGLNQSLQP